MSNGINIDTKIPVWVLITVVFTTGGGWYLINQNKSDIIQFNASVIQLTQSVTKLNETMIRYEERSVSESKTVELVNARSIENEKKLIEHESKIQSLERSIDK